MTDVDPDDLDGDPEDDVRVNVRTTRAKRAKWKQYANDNDDVGSMSHLIHRGVEEYIARQKADDGTSDPTVKASSGEEESDSVDFDAIRGVASSGEVTTQLDVLNERLSSIEERLTGQSDPDVAAKAARRLPPERPETEAWAERKPDKPEPTDPVEWSGKVGDVTEAMQSDATAERVAEALDTLVTTGTAERAVIGGTARYWSEESAANGGVDDPIPESLRGVPPSEREDALEEWREGQR